MIQSVWLQMLASSFPIYLLSQQVLRSEIFATPRALDADTTTAQPPCDNATSPPPSVLDLEHMACANDAAMQKRGGSHRDCLFQTAALM